jgi:hypothetical protein
VPLVHLLTRQHGGAESAREPDDVSSPA